MQRTPSEIARRGLDRIRRRSRHALLLGGTCLTTLLLLTLLDSCRRIEEAAPFSPAQMRAAVAAARAGVESAWPRASSPLPGGGALAGLHAEAPVFVTLYGPGATGRAQPSLGWWHPTEEVTRLPMSDALWRAGRAAGEQLRETGQRSTRGVTLKVDVSGPPKPVRLTAAWYLALVLSPGQDGVGVAWDEQLTWFLPSWAVERGVAPEAAARDLIADAAPPGRSATVVRFRTVSFLQGLDEPSVIFPLFRGNALVARPTDDAVRDAVIQAGRFLAGSVKGDGSYCYTYLPLEDRCDRDYNVLRHAGTTYALFQIQRAAPSRGVLSAAERAAGWLRDRVRHVDGDPARAYLLDGDQAKLGATALTLIALVERERAIRDGRDLELMRKLAAFLISQQREDGYFHSYFGWKPGLEVPIRQSIYYPGEALLALIRLHQIEPAAPYLETALRGADFLVHRRWRWAGIELYVPPDAWLAQALSELDAVRPTDALRDYAYEIIDFTDLSMLRRAEGAPPDLVGGPAAGFRAPPVTPAGSRIEAASAVWRMAHRRGETSTAAHLRELCLSSARFQLNQQYRPENSYFLPNPGRARGGFRGSPLHSEVRIDYVQHNVSALLGVLHVLGEGAP